MAEPAVHELEKNTLGLEIIWRAFELRPEPGPTLDPNGDYLQRVWTSSVYPLAEKLGIEMRLPPVQPRSRLAHEAAQWALRNGSFNQMHAEIFRAFFQRGEDISQPGVLVSLAEKLELDGDSLARALENGEFTERVLDDEEEAGLLGVTGVPAFIANRRYALTGVQPLERLQMIVERARGFF